MAPEDALAAVGNAAVEPLPGSLRVLVDRLLGWHAPGALAVAAVVDGEHVVAGVAKVAQPVDAAREVDVRAVEKHQRVPRAGRAQPPALQPLAAAADRNPDRLLV